MPGGPKIKVVMMSSRDHDESFMSHGRSVDDKAPLANRDDVIELSLDDQERRINFLHRFGVIVDRPHIASASIFTILRANQGTSYCDDIFVIACALAGGT